MAAIYTRAEGLAPPSSNKLASWPASASQDAAAALEVLVRRGDLVRVEPDTPVRRPGHRRSARAIARPAPASGPSGYRHRNGRCCAVRAASTASRWRSSSTPRKLTLQMAISQAAQALIPLGGQARRDVARGLVHSLRTGPGRPGRMGAWASVNVEWRRSLGSGPPQRPRACDLAEDQWFRGLVYARPVNWQPPPLPSRELALSLQRVDQPPTTRRPTASCPPQCRRRAGCTCTSVSRRAPCSTPTMGRGERQFGRV